ncbi:MAG: hypothetical protein AAGL69_04845 [Pseudomonadota bacterium]
MSTVCARVIQGSDVELGSLWRLFCSQWLRFVREDCEWNRDSAARYEHADLYQSRFLLDATKLSPNVIEIENSTVEAMLMFLR